MKINVHKSHRLLICLMVIFIAVCRVEIIKGQTDDFTGYQLSPMFTNPGDLGKDDYLQVISAFRKKNLTPDFGLTTSTISAIYPYYKGRHSLKRSGAIGISIFNESSGANKMFQMNGITFGLAHYLKTTSVTAFGFGLQVGYRQRKIDLSKITTDSQFSLDGFDPGLDNNENFQHNQSSALSISTGFTWNMRDEEGADIAHVGVAIYNLDRGSIPLIKSDDPLITKFITYAKYRLVHKNNISFYPNFRWIREAKNDQFNFGVSIVKKRGENNDKGYFGISSWFNFEKTTSLSIEYFKSPYLVAMGYEIPLGNTVVEKAVGNAVELIFIWKIDRVMDLKIKRAKTSY